MPTLQVTSRRPYLLRAMHEWITDNHQTPHMVVDATVTDVEVPRQFVQDGKIILNISYSATNGLVLGNDKISFRARFGGATCNVQVPVNAILGIYSRETGQGMILSEIDATVPPPAPTAPSSPTGGAPAKESKRPSLKVVK
jgi:stringent starvation protein B